MDINQVITLGIGTPSGLQEFLTFGLQVGEEVTVYEQIYAASVAIRETALASVAIRQTAQADAEL